MSDTVNWNEAVQPLLHIYKDRKPVLQYENIYQLLVMLILSGQDTDTHINKVAPELFRAYPDMSSLLKASQNDLVNFIGPVRNSNTKAEWLMRVARQLRDSDVASLTFEELLALPGIGRKSAHLLRHEAGQHPAGVMVDVNVIRVVNRLGIASGEEPRQVEKQLMNNLSPDNWNAGVSMSYLGRDTCRPGYPNHSQCVMKQSCSFYLSLA